MKAEEKIDKDKLYEFYIIQNHNGKETAEYFNTSVATINRAVRLRGFRKEPEMSWKNQSLGKKSKNQISKEDLYDYYIVQNHSHKECEEFFNTTYAIIHSRLKEYGIKKDPKKTYEVTSRSVQKKYGVSNPSLSEDIKVKKKTTTMLHYGVEYPSQSDEVKRKFRKTCVEKYGVPNPSCLENVKQRKIAKSLERFGTQYPIQNPEIKKKAIELLRKSLMEKYGRPNTGTVLLNEFAYSILSDKNRLSSFIDECGLHNAKSIANKLNVSICTLYNYLYKYNMVYKLNHASSVYEDELKSILKENKIKCYKTRKIIYPLEIDLYCPNFKIGVEFNGNVFHGFVDDCPPKGGRDMLYHKDKSMAGVEAGVFIFHIFEYEYIENRDKCIMNMLSKFFIPDFNCYSLKDNLLYYNDVIVCKFVIDKEFNLIVSDIAEWFPSEFIYIYLAQYFYLQKISLYVNINIAKENSLLLLSNGFSFVKDYQPSCIWCDSLSNTKEYIDDKSIIEENKNKKYWRIYDCGRRLLRYDNNIEKGGSE